jgi:hypothetical protein
MSTNKTLVWCWIYIYIYIYHSISIWLDLGLTRVFLSLVLGETMSTQCRKPNNNLTRPWLGMVNKQPIKMVMLGDCLWPWVYHIVHFRTQFCVLPNQRGKRRRGPRAQTPRRSGMTSTLCVTTPFNFCDWRLPGSEMIIKWRSCGKASPNSL